MPETEIRPASTVMLIRDGDRGVQVFILRRSAQAVFAGGMYVFPGGRVDAVDGPPGSDAAARVAAIRECFEEAGVLLATADGQPIGDGHPALAHRHQVHDGELAMAELCARYGLTLSTAEIVPTQRWVTPTGEMPRRFDTRFYVAAQPTGQTGAVHDDMETVASAWVTAADAAAQHERGELFLLPPTLAAMRFLAGHSTVDEVLAAARLIGDPPVVLPRLKRGATWEVVLPGEPGYDELD